MLFVLTGDIQAGKTRWLQSLAAELREAGVACCGVLAPGVWVEHPVEDFGASAGFSFASHDGSSGVGYEKLGIDNVLLPSGEVVAFARRRDLAVAEGSYVEGSQSARAKLGWEISETALLRVNKHLARLSGGCLDGESEPGASGSKDSFLIIDELGPLELLRGGGLVEALALLDRGPGERFPNALVVVRETLVDAARERFGGLWGEPKLIIPGDAAREAIMDAALPKG